MVTVRTIPNNDFRIMAYLLRVINLQLINSAVMNTSRINYSIYHKGGWEKMNNFLLSYFFGGQVIEK